MLFVNGLPLAVLELKNAADEDATIWTAFQQLKTYRAEVPALFATNAVLVVSDGVEERAGMPACRQALEPPRGAGHARPAQHSHQRPVGRIHRPPHPQRNRTLISPCPQSPTSPAAARGLGKERKTGYAL